MAGRPSANNAMGNTVKVGQIVAAFGIRGQVKVKPLTDFLERFDVGRRLRLDGDWVTVEASGDHKGTIVLTLSGIKDRTTAESLQWHNLEAMVDERPELEEGEYLTEDLIGLEALDESGRSLGKVENVLRYPAHDVLVVAGVMVPAVSEFVASVDLTVRKIVLRPIPGMFEDDDVS